MYKLTARMEQHLEADLRQYHSLFDGDRCSGWELEELIVRAIRSDTTAQHLPRWTEAGHDDEADILVRTNGKEYPVQIKSGKIVKDNLVLSGHRLGRFQGVLEDVSEYLNSAEANIIAVPYRKTDDEAGRHHEYTICYVPIRLLREADGSAWEKHGAQYRQTTGANVEYSLRPSMSWQIWWKIPVSLIEVGKTMKIT